MAQENNFQSIEQMLRYDPWRPTISLMLRATVSMDKKSNESFPDMFNTGEVQGL